MKSSAVVVSLLAAGWMFAPGPSLAALEDEAEIAEMIARVAEDESKEEKNEDAEKKSKSSKKKKKRRLSAEERLAERRANERRIRKKGRKVDPYASVVPDPDDIPDESSEEAQKVMSMWRLDKLKEVTYTQFWQLVRDGHVERARYGKDERTLMVTLKETAPGGAREVKIGLPYDPELYNHMLMHDVFIEAEKEHLLQTVLFMMIRLAFPVIVCYCLVQFSFRIGQKESEDDIFGGANLDMMHAKQSKVTFEDIAGIDQVKDEIKEIVAFLKNPKKFTDMGAKSPAGLLLVGPPGTGKTLLAKAIAGESRVPFFSTAGTEFTAMYVGVGAARVRDMFQRTREAAPCILFIDEFDGIGQKRSSDGGDESVHTINQLLTEMDGFEDNTGVVVIAATNRPNALDAALTRPGRFDRVVHLPLPNMNGRVEILKVHSRDKLVSPNMSYSRAARATAGFTGAQLMNLMNQSAIVAVRQRRDIITEMDVFDALEMILTEKRERGLSAREYDEEVAPELMRRSIAVYEAGKALVGLMSPAYDEVYKVSVCPGGAPTGSTFFLPREERLESRVVTRGYMEAKLVVCLAGRCAERLLLGDANISTAGAADLNQANAVAKEMIYRCGFSKQLGPVALMDSEDTYVAEQHRTSAIGNISTDIARIAFDECRQLLDAAEAKAYYGLATNFKVLEALIELLLRKEVVGFSDLTVLAVKHNLLEFKSPYVSGYGWDANGHLLFPGDGRPSAIPATNGRYSSIKKSGLQSWWDPANPYQLRWDLQNILRQNFIRGSDH